MGGVLHAQRRVHQSVRRRRQSALPAGDGARRRRQIRKRIAAAPPPGRGEIPRSRPGRVRALTPAARRRGAGTARPEIGVGDGGCRDAGFRVLHRLQRAQDTAYRAARARYHGCDRHQLSGDGRTEPLLRRHAAAPGRRRDVRPHGRHHRRQTVAVEVRSGDLVVPELLCPVHRNHAADDRAAARRASSTAGSRS